jgi:mRNA interferase MazF
VDLTSERLPERSWVKISQVRTLSVNRLGKKITRLAPERIALLVEGLNEIISD